MHDLGFFRANYDQIAGRLPELRHMIAIEDASETGAISLDDLRAMSEGVSGDELERLAAQSVPETALPHVRDGERLVPLDEGAIVRAGRAPVVEH